MRGLGGGPASWQFTISFSSGKISKEGTASELKSVENLVSTLGHNAASENRMKVVPVSSVPWHNYHNTAVSNGPLADSLRWALFKRGKIGRIAMTELHNSSSTSNSPFQTQLPHICTAAASPDSPRKVGWWAKNTKKTKTSFIFGCSSSRTPKAPSLLSAGTETANEVCHISIRSFSSL